MSTTVRRVVLTEARQCIKDVFKSQNALEAILLKNPHFGSFESMVQKSLVGSSNLFHGHIPSCGNTLRCWTSLFLSSAQINKNSLYNIVSGGIIRQAIDNPNLSFLLAAPTLARTLPSRVSNSLLHRLPSFCSNSATKNVTELSRLLFLCGDVNDTDEMIVEEEEHLPRVFFCSMSWVTVASLNDIFLPVDYRGGHRGQKDTRKQIDSLRDPRKASKNSNSNSNSNNNCHQTNSMLDESNSSGAQDHEWVVVKSKVRSQAPSLLSRKHYRYQYQVIQGYMASTSATAKGSSNIDGYNLLQWQASSNPYASIDGFGELEMKEWLISLQLFATNHTWDSGNHLSSFSVEEKHMEGCTYYPAFSFRQLDDETILGVGERPLMEALETTVNDWTQNQIASV